MTEALCWAHGRRKFYELADIATTKKRGKRAPPISPLALEAVKRINALFDIEREINGEAAEHRLAVRQERSASFVAELEDWMRTERAGLSRHADVAKAMDYMLKRWDGFARFLDDGRICLTNNAAERALRPLCLGRKSWLFAGSDRGGERAAVMYTLIGTAKLNDVDPRLGSPTSSPASQSSRRPGCTSCSPGTGRPNGNRPSPRSRRPPVKRCCKANRQRHGAAHAAVFARRSHPISRLAASIACRPRGPGGNGVRRNRRR